MANLVNRKWCQKSWKMAETLENGYFSDRTDIKSFPMNTNMAGFKRFSDISAFLCLSWKLPRHWYERVINSKGFLKVSQVKSTLVKHISTGMNGIYKWLHLIGQTMPWVLLNAWLFFNPSNTEATFAQITRITTFLYLKPHNKLITYNYWEMKVRQESINNV